MGTNWIYPTVAILCSIVLWQLCVTLLAMPAYLLPPPLGVLERLASDFRFLLYHSWITTLETLGGFFLSIVIGIPLGILLVWSRVLERAIMPLLVVSQAFPKVAVAPLIIIWFGLGLLPKVLIAFSVAFFPIVVSTVAGMRSVESDLNDLARSMQSSALKTFLKIRLPFAMPYIFSGLKVAIAFATVGAVVGEWVGAESGLGYLLLSANANLDTTLLFSVLVALMVIGLVLYYAVEFAERLTIPWHISVRGDEFTAR
ncbi:ABC transporter permease [Bosea sp. (in: a-proteobacteria)]|uniref:ABC transporter permease n=1 Tax=Bosea sp. (in: a-proteobacteria) TaxID=1871050 RepID=UPI002627BC4F|nr:ABC transporter permease [Bosea sp. (in: a-proteobacteria)]MCO5089953.1 ABC transporter permease [Bosea sp. (in: a-proteobacteria)]